MSNTTGIDATIAASIYTNGVGKITAATLAATLVAIVAWVSATFLSPAQMQNYLALQYGLKCDSFTDDSAAGQALVNKIIAAGGGTLVLPAGPACMLPSGLIENLSAYTTDAKPFVNINGQGPTVSVIRTLGLAGPAISIAGNATDDVNKVRLSNFSLYGNNTTGSVGVNLSFAAWATVDNIDVESFAKNLVGTDIEQIGIYNSQFRLGGIGVDLEGATTATGANSIVFVNDAISNNANQGILVKNFGAVAFYGGSIQFNGATGVVGDYGALFEDTAGGSFCGYNTINFNDTVFEGNGGGADLEAYTQYCPGAALNVTGSSFYRHSTGYATNNIAMLGSVSQSLSVEGSTFLSDSVYTPSSGRPTIALSNASAMLFDHGSNYYQNAVEAPTALAWIQYTPIVICGTSGTLTAYTATARYKLLEAKAVAANIDIVISNAGSCSGSLVFSLPSGQLVNTTLYSEGSGMNGTTSTLIPLLASGQYVQLYPATVANNHYFGSVTYELQ